MGRKITIFALFYFVFDGKFQVQAPRGRRDDLTSGFLGYHFGGLIFGGAYTWMGLFSEFYGTMKLSRVSFFGEYAKKKLSSQIASSFSNLKVSIIHFEAALSPIKEAIASSKQSRDAVRHRADPVLCAYSK